MVGLPRISPVGWFIRLLPGILFFSHSYSKRGAFQPEICAMTGIGCPKNPTPLTGILERHDYYGQVVSYYASLFTNHADLGGSFAVFVDGKPVIDIYAGAKDLSKSQEYNNKTLQQVYSTGMVVEGIVIAKLVDQGKLDYEKKISFYWPEFGQSGKEDVTLQDLLTHQAGVPYLDDDKTKDEEPLNWSLIANEEKFSNRLARQPHLFNGERKNAYHCHTRGWYLNEIVRRVDPQGRTIGQIAEQDLMSSYPDVELYFSKLPNEADWKERLSPTFDYPIARLFGRLFIPRSIQTNRIVGIPNIAPLHPIVKDIFFKKGIAHKVLAPKFAPYPSSLRTEEAHAVESTSFTLKSNAHSLARLMSLMANKGASAIPGQPDLLSKETYEKATSLLVDNKKDEITGETISLSTGGWFKLDNFYGNGPLKNVVVQGWAGDGGSLAVWIEEYNIGFAYVTNAFGAPETVLGDYRSKILLDRVVYARKDELGLLPKVAPENNEEDKK